MWEIEKTAGCGRLKKLQVLEAEKIAGWVKKLWGAGWVKQFWGGSKIAGRMTNCRVGGICRRGWKVVGVEIRWSNLMVDIMGIVEILLWQEITNSTCQLRIKSR